MNKSSGLILFPLSLQQKSLTLLIQGVTPVKEEGLILIYSRLVSMPQERPQNTAFGIRKCFVMQILLTCETSQPEL